MAEPHDTVERPGGAGLPASFPAGPPPAAAPVEEAYRPLSLLALVGFGIAAVYAALVLLLALVSFKSGKPLLLGTLAWVVPLLAALDCAVAWLRISRSEGTLAGGALARWGLLLAGFVGLGYGAYYAAVNMALRQQAEQFAADWLDQIRQGHLDRAIFRTMPPLQRLDLNEEDKDLLDKIALNLPAAEEISARTIRSQFAQQPVVDLLARGGDKTTFKARGIKGWEPSRGGFEVAVSFHVETPEAEGEIVVTVHGMSAPNGEFAGRQWAVVRDKTGIDQQEGGLRPTPLGERTQRLGGSALQFFMAPGKGWLPTLRNDKVEAFLLTLPVEQRPSRRQSLGRALGIGTLAGAGAVAAADLETLAAYHRFVAGPASDGGWVVIADDVSAEDGLRKTVESMVRNLFNEQAAGPPPEFQKPQRPPAWTHKGDRVQFAIDIRLMGGPMIMAEGTAVVEGDARILEEDVDPRWRLASLQIVSAHKRQPPAPGRPRRR